MIFVAAAGIAELLALIGWVLGLLAKVNSDNVTAIVIIPILLCLIPVAAIALGIARVRSAPFLPQSGGDCVFMVLVIANGAAMLVYGAIMTSGF
jgi:hypothetical protein